MDNSDYTLFKGLIKCSNCGSSFVSKVRHEKRIWLCCRYKNEGIKGCKSNKGIPNTEIYRLVQEVLNAKEITPLFVKENIVRIDANDTMNLEFHLSDGRTVSKEWVEKSRKESWTEDMRHQAALYAIKGNEKQRNARIQKQNAIEAHRDELKKNNQYLVKNRININLGYKKTVTSLDSHLGDKPYAEWDFKWPYNGSTPLTFIMQINCSELEAYDRDNLLPHSGYLLFFYNFLNMFEESNNIWVHYVNENGHRINDLKAPRFPLQHLTFSTHDSYPSTLDDYDISYDVDDDELLNEYREKNNFQMLGYPDIVQCSMKQEIDEKYQKMFNKAPDDNDEWILLLQFDSISTCHIKVNIIDDGKIYYWIKKSDLLNKDFSKVVSAIQFY